MDSLLSHTLGPFSVELASKVSGASRRDFFLPQDDNIGKENEQTWCGSVMSCVVVTSALAVQQLIGDTNFVTPS